MISTPDGSPIREHAHQSSKLSIIHGPKFPPMLKTTLGRLLNDQCLKHGGKIAVICTSIGDRISYHELRERSRIIAKGLLSLGIQPGDRVGILAGNRAEYVELLFACGLIGAILAVLNNTFTPSELHNALSHSGCKLLFTSVCIGSKSNTAVEELVSPGFDRRQLPMLQEIVLLSSKHGLGHAIHRTYSELRKQGGGIADDRLHQSEGGISTYDVCNLQYTSGTTGDPKAAMLTHHNIIDNARFIGDRMGLGTDDILCCPPPLFHCFGLVLGLLAVITRGSTIVFPSETFDANAVLRSVREEHCTALHGVPAMWTAEMQLTQPGETFHRLRTGIAAGSATTRQMMEDLQLKLNLHQLTNTYGMTETSPASFMTSWDDPLEKRLSTVGKVLPHVSAKIIDRAGDTVPFGEKGEICISGYLLQKGYFRNPTKTDEVMLRDHNGTLWMHTGDEGQFDADGYCKITGRIKDMIIRGGENIFPLEIEERLMQHPSIATAAVVGLEDAKYGEIVAAFLQTKSDRARVPDGEIREWCWSKLARHKSPQHVFWIGDAEVGNEFPQTGSGKIKKNLLRDLGNKFLRGPKCGRASGRTSAKL